MVFSFIRIRKSKSNPMECWFKSVFITRFEGMKIWVHRVIFIARLTAYLQYRSKEINLAISHMDNAFSFVLVLFEFESILLSLFPIQERKSKGKIILTLRTTKTVARPTNSRRVPTSATGYSTRVTPSHPEARRKRVSPTRFLWTWRACEPVDPMQCMCRYPKL